MEKISQIVRPSNRATWKSDAPAKPERMTDPREAFGYDRSDLTVFDPKAPVQQDKRINSQVTSLDPNRGQNLDAVG